MKRKLGNTIVVRADGYRERSETIDLARGAAVPLSVALEKPAVVVAAPVPAVTLASPPRVTSAPQSKTRRAVGWTLLGTGVAALAAGVALHFDVSAEKSGQDRANTALAGTYSTGSLDLLKSREWVANGMLILSGATGIVDALLLVVRGKSVPTAAALQSGNQTGAQLQSVIRRDGALLQVGWAY